jgi:hypothetical protein
MIISSAWALNTYSNSDYSGLTDNGEKVEQVDVYKKVRSIRSIEDGFNDLSNVTPVGETSYVKEEPPKEDLYDVYYAYPSSYQSTLPYRQYKVTVLKEIWNYFSLNPKGTFEKELTNKGSDNDFDAVTGLHKDSFEPPCISPAKFIVSIE